MNRKDFVSPDKIDLSLKKYKKMYFNFNLLSLFNTIYVKLTKFLVALLIPLFGYFHLVDLIMLCKNFSYFLSITIPLTAGIFNIINVI